MRRGECKSNDYGAAAYWDARYSSPSSGSGEGGAAGFFDWYQTYPALRPLLRAALPASSRLLMLGCGNSLLSEDMVKDGYESIMNIDISSVVIEMMSKKHADIPQLTYMQMDIRDMSFFRDESFDCVLDKGTLDAMMCAEDAPDGASKMLGEVVRLLRPGGIYLLITYGAPSERVPILTQRGWRWKIMLYIIRSCSPDDKEEYYSGTSGSQSKRSSEALDGTIEPVVLTENGQLPADYVLKDPESHFIYVCHKSNASDEKESHSLNGKDIRPLSD